MRKGDAKHFKGCTINREEWKLAETTLAGAHEALIKKSKIRGWSEAESHLLTAPTTTPTFRSSLVKDDSMPSTNAPLS